jgi:hypothetical protein
MALHTMVIEFAHLGMYWTLLKFSRYKTEVTQSCEFAQVSSCKAGGRMLTSGHCERHESVVLGRL